MNPYKATKAFYRMDIAKNEILRHHILFFIYYFNSYCYTLVVKLYAN